MKKNFIGKNDSIKKHQIIDSFGAKLMEKFNKDTDEIFRDGNVYKKMPNGKYYSINSLSELKEI
jgi:hypothetical protein